MSCPDSSQITDDPDKPPFPYIIGFTTQIHRHAPLPPFGPPDYSPDPRPRLSPQYRQSVPQTELVVDSLPLETPPSQAETAWLTITTPMSVGSNRGAQVVTYSITPQGKTAGKAFQAVAKIYDALYYRLSGSITNKPSEAFVLPIASRGQAQTRPVHLILIEYLDGTSIRSSLAQNGPRRAGRNAFHYLEEYRLKVLALAIDGYVRQLHSGINQLDFAGRNVMLTPRVAGSPSAEPGRSGPVVAGLPLPRVVLVDYKAAAVFGQARTGRPPPHMNRPAPCNPMLFFWDEPVDGFRGWVPRGWHRNPCLTQEWLRTRFGTEERRELYAPVGEELVVRDCDLHGRQSGTASEESSLSGLDEYGRRIHNPDYEPPLSLKKHGFRASVFRPREPPNVYKSAGAEPPSTE